MHLLNISKVPAIAGTFFYFLLGSHSQVPIRIKFIHRVWSFTNAAVILVLLSGRLCMRYWHKYLLRATMGLAGLLKSFIILSRNENVHAAMVMERYKILLSNALLDFLLNRIFFFRVSAADGAPNGTNFQNQGIYAAGSNIYIWRLN